MKSNLGKVIGFVLRETVIGREKLEVRSWKLEVRSWKLEVGS
ncbi:hypothetical protein [Flavobacterium macrobrachii]|nr:hypothetical protein [Flavobacterium macrobrachii]